MLVRFEVVCQQFSLWPCHHQPGDGTRPTSPVKPPSCRPGALTRLAHLAHNENCWLPVFSRSWPSTPDGFSGAKQAAWLRRGGGGKLGENHAGELHRETTEQKASRIIAAELLRLSWTESDLGSRPAGFNPSREDRQWSRLFPESVW